MERFRVTTKVGEHCSTFAVKKKSYRFSYRSSEYGVICLCNRMGPRANKD